MDMAQNFVRTATLTTVNPVPHQATPHDAPPFLAVGVKPAVDPGSAYRWPAADHQPLAVGSSLAAAAPPAPLGRYVGGAAASAPRAAPPGRTPWRMKLRGTLSSVEQAGESSASHIGVSHHSAPFSPSVVAPTNAHAVCSALQRLVPSPIPAPSRVRGVISSAGASMTSI